MGTYAGSLQLIVSKNFILYDMPTKAGVRISLGLMNGTFANNTKTDETNTSSYNIFEIADRLASGYKVQITAIFGATDFWTFIKSYIKLPAAIQKFADNHIATYTTDFELTFAMSVLNGGAVRLDAIQVDPVFDWDAKTYLGKVIQKALVKIISGLSRSDVDALAGEIEMTELRSTISQARSAAWENVKSTANASGMLSGFRAGSAGSYMVKQFVPNLEPIIEETAGDAFADWPEIPNKWTNPLFFSETLELSPLRLTWPNRNLINGSTSKAYDATTVAWGPAVKFLNSAGYEISRNGYVIKFRILVGVTLGYVLGSNDAIKATVGTQAWPT